VLVGMQVPPADQDKFQAFLDKLGYPCWNVSDSTVYQLFLG
jgi:threonine dehydratase